MTTKSAFALFVAPLVAVAVLWATPATASAGEIFVTNYISADPSETGGYPLR